MGRLPLPKKLVEGMREALINNFAVQSRKIVIKKEGSQF